MNAVTLPDGNIPSAAPQQLPLTDAKGLQAIRSALLMLVLLTTAAAAGSWDRLRSLPHHVEAIPLFLFVVICVFVVLVYAKAREMAGLRGAVETLQHRQSALSSELEVQKLLQTLAASRESFRDLVDSFDSAVFTLSLDGNVRAANKAFTEGLNLPFAEVIGKSISELITEPSARKLQAALPTFLATKQWSGLVPVCIGTTGQWRYFDCTLHPVLQDSSVLAITVIAKDVTAERERETLFSALFDTLHEPVWVATCEGRLLDVNRGLTSLAGVDAKQLLNENILEMLLEPERHQMAEAMRCRQSIRDLELTLVRADGSRAFCIANATPVINVSGAAQYHGTFTDITQRRTMERKLACEQKFREQLIASFPDAIMTLDAEGRITFASGRAERMFGESASSLINTSFIDIVDPQDEIALHTFLHDCLSLPQTVCTREFHLRSSNRLAWRTVEASGTALQDDECKTLGVIASVRDVTEQRQIEQHLAATERMAAMGHVICGISHELSNSLTAMLGACALMSDIQLPPEERENLQLLRGQTMHAREVVKDLLLFAQPSAGRMLGIDVRELMKRAVALRRYSLRSKNISVDLQATGELPTVTGDRAQLMQVFLNLLVTAEAECLPGANTPGAIRVHFGVLDDFVWCTVESAGVLVAPQDEIHLSTSKYETDLRLKVSRGIVRAHGGDMDISAQPETGSQFRITLSCTH
ncbi:MAG: PAS domain S-box protein [Acidobacteriia bacterium]|nr:PAS domain S-box protein [Terriglobia bacterium]